jgi:UDP-4-amino-4,6-dideoxy-N-acetyl-beta-L-altrosamine N-acetyltransferase
MYRLRELEEKDLELLLQWRNREDVRKNMYTQHIISWEEHCSWFQNTKNDVTKKHLLFEKEGVPIAFVSFTEINNTHKTVCWGLYSGDPTQRGIGSPLAMHAIEYVFSLLKMEKLSCEALGYNQRALSFYQKHGFHVEGIFKGHLVLGGGRIDIYRLALFKKDWLNSLLGKEY